MRNSTGGVAVDAELAGSNPKKNGQRCCTHSRTVRGEVTLDFTRPGQKRASYASPVSVLVCEDCGSVNLQAEMHRFLCDWLEKR